MKKCKESNTFVILTVRGWDGSRILGLFSNHDEAMLAKERLMSDNRGNTTIYSGVKEEYIFDLVKLGKSSHGCEIIMNSTNEGGVTFRNHLYASE